MSNYSSQYKEYYNNLKKRHNSVSTDGNIKNGDRIPIYTREYGYNKKPHNDRFIPNLIIMQLTFTMVLFVFALGGIYSSNENLKKYYTKFKNSMEEKYTYTDAKADIKSIDIDSIKQKVEESIDWVKEKVGNNNLN